PADAVGIVEEISRRHSDRRTALGRGWVIYYLYPGIRQRFWHERPADGGEGGIFLLSGVGFWRYVQWPSQPVSKKQAQGRRGLSDLPDGGARPACDDPA